jgi:hypothetical protein
LEVARGFHVGSARFRSAWRYASKFRKAERTYGDFAQIAEARDAEGIESAVRGFARTTGFERYTVVMIDDDYSTPDSCITTYKMHNAPTAYAETWDDRELGRADPVLKHCKLSGAPLAYGQETLDCASKPQAVVKALRLGLID